MRSIVIPLWLSLNKIVQDIPRNFFPQNWKFYSKFRKGKRKRGILNSIFFMNEKFEKIL